MANDRTKLGKQKLLQGTKILIEAWQLLGLDRKTPGEYNKMKYTVLQLEKETHGK